ncbi:large conductance mechanosensitive channel protein MscL [Clostridium sp.]|uniref:large conductance mechanosensitive channel protein MscL n=1 Tax=Clostridium sp. TaxID=1506 RepID=UPI003216F6A9
MLKDFKKFALKGNMIDLAIGMIIGSAFTKLVTSLVETVIMPIITIFTGKIDFSNLFISLDGKDYATLATAKEAGASVVAYGSFLTGVIDFLIMAFVVFIVVRQINRFKKKEAAEPITTKKCPYCISEIAMEATRCPHCTSDLQEVQALIRGRVDREII